MTTIEPVIRTPGPVSCPAWEWYEAKAALNGALSAELVRLLKARPFVPFVIMFVEGGEFEQRLMETPEQLCDLAAADVSIIGVEVISGTDYARLQARLNSMEKLNLWN